MSIGSLGGGRPPQRLVEAPSPYNDEQPVAGDAMLQIAAMVAEQGASVRLEAVGPDAAAVLDALEPLFAGRFGDEDRGSA